MKCPYCQEADSRVLDSRPSGEESVIRRRRQCLTCERRFTTYERVEMFPLVVKSDGRREPFDERKLAAGIFRALVKRTVPSDDVSRAIQSVKARIEEQGQGEVSSQEIGEMVMASLKKLDLVAYLRYASAFKKFASIVEFADEAARLKDQEPGESG